MNNVELFSLATSSHNLTITWADNSKTITYLSKSCATTVTDHSQELREWYCEFIAIVPWLQSFSNGLMLPLMLIMFYHIYLSHARFSPALFCCYMYKWCLNFRPASNYFQNYFLVSCPYYVYILDEYFHSTAPRYSI